MLRRAAGIKSRAQRETPGTGKMVLAGKKVKKIKVEGRPTKAQRGTDVGGERGEDVSAIWGMYI